MAGTTYAYSAYLNYSERITADEITVILNGTTYTVSRQEDEFGAWYGSIELYDDGEAECQYPFCIYHESNKNKLIVSYDIYANHNPVSVEIAQESVTTTSCFDKARGYSCEEEMVTLTEETVTTTMDGNTASGTLSYSQPIGADSITVTFDGVEYECPRLSDGSYGAPYNESTNLFDWSEYPFELYSDSSNGNSIYTETAGTYSVKIEAMQEVATTTQCFEKAVQSIASPLVVKASCAPSEGTSNVPSTLDANPSEICDAMKTRGVVVEDPYGNLYSVLYATNDDVTIISSEYDSTATPPTVLHPYMYAYNNVLRYPPTIFH